MLQHYLLTVIRKNPTLCLAFVTHGDVSNQDTLTKGDAATIIHYPCTNNETATCHETEREEIPVQMAKWGIRPCPVKLPIL